MAEIKILGKEKEDKSLKNLPVYLSEEYRSKMRDSKTIIFNGIAGKYQDETFCHGTNQILDHVFAHEAESKIILGLHSVTAAQKRLGAKPPPARTYFSTMGETGLKFLAGVELTALNHLDDHLPRGR